jgi:fluoroquinolone resistance protein
MANKNELQQRWTGSAPQVESLLAGDRVSSPFGLTDEGLEDFRGIDLPQNVRPVDIHLNRYDFSYLSAKRLIFANSILADCRFDSSQFALGDFESCFRGVTFVRAKLKGSALGANGTRYIECDFSRTDLTGMTGLGGHFQNCLFDMTKFKNAVVGGGSFESCRFAGKIEGVIFGSRSGTQILNCDFTKASFTDCTFNDTRFVSCEASDDTLIIRKWASVLTQFKLTVPQVSDPEVRNASQRLIRVWEQRLDLTPENIVDLADLTKQLGPDIGQAVFRLLQEIAG